MMISCINLIFTCGGNIIVVLKPQLHNYIARFASGFSCSSEEGTLQRLNAENDLYLTKRISVEEYWRDWWKCKMVVCLLQKKDFSKSEAIYIVPVKELFCGASVPPSGEVWQNSQDSSLHHTLSTPWGEKKKRNRHKNQTKFVTWLLILSSHSTKQASYN